jgi:type II secretion system protein J
MSRRRGYGFTLIEMMVAIVIFLIFISAIYGVYAAATTSMARTEAHEEVYQTGRVLLAQLSAEFASVYPNPAGTTNGFVGEDTADAGADREEDRLTFLTTAHAVSEAAPAGDICGVIYRMEDPAQNEEPGLYVETHRTPGLEMEDAETETRRLSARVVGFNVHYWTADGEKLVEWPDSQTLPVAVRVELTLQSVRSGEKPVMLSATTNLALATAPVPATEGEAAGGGGADE